MINHVRTLLRNSTGGGYLYPGDEFVPPEFFQKKLSGWKESVWQTMFGVKPDGVMLNWRLQQYLTFIHSTELAVYATAKDSRVTYLPFGSELFERLKLGVVVTDVNGTGKLLAVTKPQFPETHSQRLLRTWTIEVTDSSSLAISYPDDFGDNMTTAAEYSITDGLSNLVDLPGSERKFSFQEGTGSKWKVEYICKPAYSPSDVLASLDQLLTEDIKRKLFLSDAVSVDLRDVWDNSPFVPYRLAAASLALASRIEEQA